MSVRNHYIWAEVDNIADRCVPITSNCCTKAADADAAFVVHYHSDRGSETKRSETEATHQLTHWVNWDVVVQGGQWW